MDNNLINKTIYKFFNKEGCWHELEVKVSMNEEYTTKTIKCEGGCKREDHYTIRLGEMLSFTEPQWWDSNPDYFTDSGQVELLREIDKDKELSLKMFLSIHEADILYYIKENTFPTKVYEWIKSLGEGK